MSAVVCSGKSTKQLGRRAAVSERCNPCSQGGLLPRWALTYWPSLRRLVTDVVAVAGTQHGTTVSLVAPSGCGSDCRVAAVWQQAAGSHLLRALARYPDESPGPKAWTTVRTLDHEVVQPTSGREPASALPGAANLVIQRVCPGRQVNHIGAGADSVSYAALIDAVKHRGSASARRLSTSVCSRPFAPHLDELETRDRVSLFYALATPRVLAGADGGKLLAAEPPVRAYAQH